MGACCIKQMFTILMPFIKPCQCRCIVGSRTTYSNRLKTSRTYGTINLYDVGCLLPPKAIAQWSKAEVLPVRIRESHNKSVRINFLIKNVPVHDCVTFIISMEMKFKFTRSRKECMSFAFILYPFQTV